MPKEILNGIEYGNGIDHQKLLKIGDAPLDTTADNLSDAVNELNSALSQLQNSEWLDDFIANAYKTKVKYKINSNVIYISINDIELTSRTLTTIGTLPTAYRPQFQLNLSGLIGGSNLEYAGLVRVETSGEIKLWQNIGSTHNFGVISIPL